MRNVKAVVAMALLVFPVLQSTIKAELKTEVTAEADGSQLKIPLQSQPQGDAQKADDSQVKENPQLEEFVGKWVGKWSDVFYVRFTITPTDDKENLTVLYEWEENVGQPLHRRVLTGKIEGNILKSTGETRRIDLSLAADDANRGQAYGHFINPRIAILTREKPKE